MIFYAYEFKVVQHLGPATPHGISINCNRILFALMLYNRLGGGTRYDIQYKRSWSDMVTSGNNTGIVLVHLSFCE